MSIIRTCGHIRCVNSKALEMAGITKDTPDPQGGQIDRDENGEPTGVLRESARNLVTPLIPETTEEQKVDLVVDLEPWDKTKNYSRTGLETDFTIFWACRSPKR